MVSSSNGRANVPSRTVVAAAAATVAYRIGLRFSIDLFVVVDKFDKFPFSTRIGWTVEVGVSGPWGKTSSAFGGFATAAAVT